MQEDRIPKVFISYSWSSDAQVLSLAQRLIAHGVDVVLDKWDLKEGQDKYAFMERCVNDPEITKVLIVCDKQYADKANNRTGGVGDETVIISSEIYGNIKQEKFIPIITERDEMGLLMCQLILKHESILICRMTVSMRKSMKNCCAIYMKNRFFENRLLGKNLSGLTRKRQIFFP